jgi:hypothetical protein
MRDIYVWSNAMPLGCTLSDHELCHQTLSFVTSHNPCGLMPCCSDIHSLTGAAANDVPTRKAYTGGVAAVDPSNGMVTLSSNPYGPGSGSYAPSRDLHVGANWVGAAIVVLAGKGEGQWRRVTHNHNRSWGVVRGVCS